MAWADYLPSEAVDLSHSILQKVQDERRFGYTIYPSQKQILRALDLTPPENVKVVLLGQDPYHAPDQANGLCFSVTPGTPLPPSLKNIFKEYQSDLGYAMPSTGDLTPWADEGVLMLNTILSVRRGEPLSHRKLGWERFTNAVLHVCFDLPQPVIFLLWGGTARAACGDLPLGSVANKVAIVSSHPSPLGATKASAAAPAFLGCRPFSRVNTELTRLGSSPINWKLP